MIYRKSFYVGRILEISPKTQQRECLLFRRQGHRDVFIVLAFNDRSTVLGNGPTKILKYLYPGFFFECFEDEMRKRKVPDSSSALRDHQLLSPCSTCPALWTLLGLFSQMLVLSGTHLAFGVHLPRREPSCHTSSSRHFLSACFRGDCKLGDSFLWFLL